MKTRGFLSASLFALALVAGIAWVSTAAGSGPGSPCTRPLRWGFLAQTDQPFYPSGGTARVLLAQYNFSGVDAFGYSTVSGGNGCIYRVEVRDASGNVVWEPGSLDGGGNYSPTICLTVIVNRDLRTGCILSSGASVPLIYQNGQGNGTNGQPLPPGYYSVCASMQFHGPDRTQGNFPPGTDPSACVPIQIE